MNGRLLTTGLSGLALLAITGQASAQHQHFNGHYDVVPGHYHQHGGHLDYHPAQTIYHPSPIQVHQTSPSLYYPSNGYPSNGYPSNGYPSNGYPSNGYPSNGYPSNGYVTGGYPSTTHRTDYYPRTADVSPSIIQSPSSQWNSFGHVDELAMSLEKLANAMCLEMHYNYKHNPGFAETYGEAYEVLQTTREIHAMEHAGDRDSMREAALRIDGLFHHVQDDVRHWTRYGRRYFGPGGLRERMDAVEDVLHHLMQDVGANSQYGEAETHNELAPPAGIVQP